MVFVLVCWSHMQPACHATIGRDEPYKAGSERLARTGALSDRTGRRFFEYTFRDLSPEDEADFLHALKPGPDGKIKAFLGISHGDMDKGERLRVRKWCGDHKRRLDDDRNARQSAERLS